MNKLSIIEQNVRSQLRCMNTTSARQKQTPTEYCLQLVRYLSKPELHKYEQKSYLYHRCTCNDIIL